jgi:putative N6-adenine-specific DNA methylase
MSPSPDSATALADYFAVSALGIEPITGEELVALGAQNVEPTVGGVKFRGDQTLLYRAHLWLRTATRILRPLREFAATTPEMLYSQVRRVRWEEYLDPQKTFAISATRARQSRSSPEASSFDGGSRLRGMHRPGASSRTGKKREAGSDRLQNPQFAALKIKDAVVDRLRREQGARPNVDRHHPDIAIQAHFSGGRCILSLDATGSSLHERGYRVAGTEAPLKETLAAAMLAWAGWHAEMPLLDPMCGSGTLIIEGALCGLQVAPGLTRPEFAFERWPDFNPGLWQQTRSAAQARRLPRSPVPIFGSDLDPVSIAAATANARAAGVSEAIRFSTLAAEELSAPTPFPGLLVFNPPYGTRLGTEAELRCRYRKWGEVWPRRFAGWTVVMLAGNLSLARELGLQADEKLRVCNGPLDCRLLKFRL